MGCLEDEAPAAGPGADPGTKSEETMPSPHSLGSEGRLHPHCSICDSPLRNVQPWAWNHTLAAHSSPQLKVTASFPGLASRPHSSCSLAHRDEPVERTMPWTQGHERDLGTSEAQSLS